MVMGGLAVLVGLYWVWGMFDGGEGGAVGDGVVGGAELAVVSSETDLLLVLDNQAILNSEVSRRLSGEGSGSSLEGWDEPMVEVPRSLDEETFGLGLPDLSMRGKERLLRWVKGLDVVSVSVEAGDPAGVGEALVAGAFGSVDVGGWTVQFMCWDGLDVEELVAAASELHIGSLPMKVEPWVPEGRVGYRGRFGDEGGAFWLLIASDGVAAFLSTSEGRVRAAVDRGLGRPVLRDAGVHLALRIPESHRPALALLGDVGRLLANQEGVPAGMRFIEYLGGLTGLTANVRFGRQVVFGLRAEYVEAGQAAALGRLVSEMGSLNGEYLNGPPEIRSKDVEVFVRVRMSSEKAARLLE